MASYGNDVGEVTKWKHFHSQDSWNRVIPLPRDKLSQLRQGSEEGAREKSWGYLEIWNMVGKGPREEIHIDSLK